MSIFSEVRIFVIVLKLYLNRGSLVLAISPIRLDSDGMEFVLGPLHRVFESGLDVFGFKRIVFGTVHYFTDAIVISVGKPDCLRS